MAVLQIITQIKQGNNMNKEIIVLGATGSVGLQALDVARKRGYKIDVISASRDVSGMESAILEFSPRVAVMADFDAAGELAKRVGHLSTEVLFGEEALLCAIKNSEAEVAVNAISGRAGLMPTLAIIDSGKRLALANKESLVIAGDIVMSRARKMGVEILPVDSEHSAIFQSMLGNNKSEVSKLILTASGGPFYGKSREDVRNVTPKEVLSHPTWKMGKKITVDSATLVNKGFEIIEACHLFGIPEDKIEVLIHRESILHSAVEYIDRAIIGQMSVPDMRECVQYAVDYPNRKEAVIEPLNLAKIGKLTFAEPDYSAFPLLMLSRKALRDGGAMGAVLEAADSRAVEAYFNGDISFGDISDTVIAVYEKMIYAKEFCSLEEILKAHSEATGITDEIIRKKSKK